MLILLVIISSITLIYLFSLVVACLINRVPVKEFNCGYGPKLFKFKIGKMLVKCCAIPICGFIKMDDDKFEQKNKVIKLFINLSGCLILWIIGALIMGVSDSAISLIVGFKQFIVGAIYPQEIGSKLISSVLKLLKNNNYLLVFGILSVKMSAANSIPVLLTCGGRAIAIISDFILKKNIVNNSFINIISMLILLLLYIGWGIAFYYAIF